MRDSDFSSDSPGILVPIEGASAFLPFPLPPALDLPPSTQKTLEQATHLVGTLNGLGRSLHNPNLIIQPFVRREAVLSSKIEGTVASFSDLVLFEADPKTNKRDANEVYNYVRALQEAIEKAKQFPVALRLICETHARLTEGIERERYVYPGVIRNAQVYIGDERLGLKRARFVPPPPSEILGLMSNFENYVNNTDDDTNLLVRLAIAHYQFETIHPFIDGNGRLGRLLIALLLCVERRLCVPILYISAFLSSHKQRYYDLLLSVSTSNNWTEWVHFFLEGIVETASDAISRAEKLLDLHKAYRERLNNDGCGDVAQQVLDLLFTYPAYTIPKVAKRLNRTYPTVQLATDKLLERGMVRLWPESSKPKIYLGDQIIGILEDTKLLLEEPAA